MSWIRNVLNKMKGRKNMSGCDNTGCGCDFGDDKLTKEQREVLRKEGTERPFSSPLNDEKRTGKFVCAGCGQVLFSSDSKFDSGTGWPSFFQVIEGSVETKEDLTYPERPRVEYHCANCGGHQGHVFEDGPEPTGLRYCNNGLALSFIPDDGGDA